MKLVIPNKTQPAQRKIVVKRTTTPSASPRKIVVRSGPRKPRPDGNVEQVIISTVLSEHDHITVIAAGVTVEWFHAYENEWAFIERYIRSNGRTPKPMTFKGKFPDFEFTNSWDLDVLIEDLKQAHTKHGIMSAINDVATDIRDGKDAIEALSHHQRALAEVVSQISGTHNEMEAVEEWMETYKEIERRQERVKQHGMAGIPTGFDDLDLFTGGLQPGDYYVIAARLGQGKTWTLVRMAATALIAGRIVQYDTLEQSRTQINMRLQSFLSGHYGKQVFRSIDMMTGHRQFDLLAYRKFCQEMSSKLSGKLYINDTSRGRVNPGMIAAQIERNKPSVVFVDYLTLMDSSGDDWRSTRDLSAEMKGLAMRYEIPVVVAAQINRSGTGKEPPGPETLSGSDAIGQDADGIVTMKQISARVMRMRLAKYRHGPDGQQWWCRFSPNTGQFEQITGDEAEAISEEDREVQ